MAKQKRKRLVNCKKDKQGKSKSPYWEGAQGPEEEELEAFFDWLNQTTRDAATKSLESVDYFHIFKMAQQGMLDEHIAHVLGLPRARFKSLKKHDPNVARALEAGKAHAIEFATAQLRDLIIAKDKAAIFFFLKSRGGWKEHTVHEVEDRTDGDSASRLQQLLSQATDDQIERLVGVLREIGGQAAESGVLIDGTVERIDDTNTDGNESSGFGN